METYQQIYFSSKANHKCFNLKKILYFTGQKKYNLPLHSITVDHPFGVDIMELLVTANRNCYVIVFQDFFPVVFPAPDQKAKCIAVAELFVKEVVPMFGVPEALYITWQRNKSAHAGCVQSTRHEEVKYHSKLSSVQWRIQSHIEINAKKHVSKFDVQCDVYLLGVLWVYRHTTLNNRRETFTLMFGFACHHPTEAATLTPRLPNHINISDSREQLILSLYHLQELWKRNR